MCVLGKDGWGEIICEERVNLKDSCDCAVGQYIEACNSESVHWFLLLSFEKECVLVVIP